MGTYQFAANGGANQVGNGAQIKAETETGFAYGVETDQGTNWEKI